MDCRLCPKKALRKTVTSKIPIVLQAPALIGLDLLPLLRVPELLSLHMVNSIPARRYQVRSWILCIACLLFISSPSLATTIFAIRTSSVFVIAADSEQTGEGGGKPDTRRSGRKIFAKGHVLYALGGLVKDPNRGYDPENTIAASLEETQSFQSAAEKVETIFNAFKEELLRLQTEEPILFRKEIERDDGGTSVLLASFEKEEALAVAIGFRGKLGSDGKLLVERSRLACPGDCPNGVMVFYVGSHKASQRYLAENGMPTLPLEEAVRFMVQLEIDAKTPGVGPPIVVVRLDRNGIHWLPSADR
jgi:hypothetical protein